MEDAIVNTTTKATNSLIEQGILGVFVVLLIIFCGILLWVLLKDKKYQKTISEALARMVENQNILITEFRVHQKHSQNSIKTMIEAIKSERQNSKECMDKLLSRLDK